MVLSGINRCSENNSTIRKEPAHYDPEGSKPRDSQPLAGTREAQRKHAIAQNSNISSPLSKTNKNKTTKEPQKVC